MKRIMAAVITICAVFLGIFLLADYSNNRLIEKFEAGIYEHNPLGFLGFTEPYVNYYNRGNIYYALGQYDLACQEYEKALQGRRLEEYSDCRLRVNYALAIVKQIDPNNITEDNIDEVLAMLDEARDLLCEDGCASRTDNSGHYPDAQTLKNEIDAFEASLLGPEEDDEEDPQPSPTPSPTPTPEPGSEPDTPTPTPDPSQDGPTPTPEGGEGGEPDQTEPDGGADGATPTPTMTPEQQLMDLQNQGQQERYDAGVGEEDTSWGGFHGGIPW